MVQTSQLPEGRLPQNIESDLAKLDVLLIDVFHATKDISILSDLELKAL